MAKLRCDCSMSTRLVGDGCEACNPSLAVEFLLQTVADQADEIARLAAEVERHRMTLQERNAAALFAVRPTIMKQRLRNYLKRTATRKEE